MKTLRLTAAAFAIATFFAVSALAQTPAPALKIMFINTVAFDGKDGITKYSAAMTGLENEFKPVETELKGLQAKYQTLVAEAKALEAKLTSATTVPINVDEVRGQYAAKGDEIQNLELQVKRKNEDAKSKFERRQAEVLGPLMKDIANAIQDFAKQKGYDVILDSAKLDNSSLLLAFNEAKADVTKEFIAFYNARPATAARP